jgi:pilus assembly protein TadC
MPNSEKAILFYSFYSFVLYFGILFAFSYHRFIARYLSFFFFLAPTEQFREREREREPLFGGC